MKLFKDICVNSIFYINDIIYLKLDDKRAQYRVRRDGHLDLDIKFFSKDDKVNVNKSE